jgi:phage shock protein E
MKKHLKLILIPCCFTLISCSNGTPLLPPTEKPPEMSTGADSLSYSALIDAGALVIDARSPEEYRESHYPKAINIPHTELNKHRSLIGDNLDRAIIVYCRSGRRAGLLRDALMAAGFRNVHNAVSAEALNDANT